MDKVQNPKQLYVISLGKVRKIVSFWQICWCAAGENYDFCEIFGVCRLKFKGLLCERRRRERKFWNILQESSIFMYLEEKAAQNVDLFARLGGAGAPSAPPSLQA